MHLIHKRRPDLSRIAVTDKMFIRPRHIAAYPGNCCIVSAEAGEPGVTVFICRSRFTRKALVFIFDGHGRTVFLLESPHHHIGQNKRGILTEHFFSVFRTVRIYRPVNLRNQ